MIEQAICEHDAEPIRGLPGRLPPGERMLWQGAPDAGVLARTAFHTRGVGLYFAALTAFALVRAAPHAHGLADFTGTAATAGVGVVGVTLLYLLAWATARATVYTITNRRVVLRVGVAVSKCVNLPLALVQSAELRVQADGTGDLPLRLSGRQALGWVALWPHARPWRLAVPEPMLRAIPEASAVAALLARACAEAQGARVTVPAPRVAPAVPQLEPVAA